MKTLAEMRRILQTQENRIRKIARDRNLSAADVKKLNEYKKYVKLINAYRLLALNTRRFILEKFHK